MMTSPEDVHPFGGMQSSGSAIRKVGEWCPASNGQRGAVCFCQRDHGERFWTSDEEDAFAPEWQLKRLKIAKFAATLVQT